MPLPDVGQETETSDECLVTDIPGEDSADSGIPRTTAGMRQAIRCPDCDSHVTITELSPGVFSGQVAHDDTCPWYAELKRDLS